jgi:hypothetical protein
MLAPRPPTASTLFCSKRRARGYGLSDDACNAILARQHGAAGICKRSGVVRNADCPNGDDRPANEFSDAALRSHEALDRTGQHKEKRPLHLARARVEFFPVGIEIGGQDVRATEAARTRGETRRPLRIVIDRPRLRMRKRPPAGARR